MISSLIKRFTFFIVRHLMRLRYRVRIKGLEKIKSRKGLLFLGNHPSELDPLFLHSYLFSKFKPRFVAAEFTFYLPLIGSLVRWLDTVSVPEFRDSSNSYKKEALNTSLAKCHKALEDGENLFVFPAGQLTRGGKEAILGGTSITEILERRPQTEVVLVSIKGMRGSVFSAGIEKRPLPVITAIKKALLSAFKAFFLLPKREVEIEFEHLLHPYPLSRSGFRETLEAWFNRGGEEPLKEIPYSFWKKKRPQRIIETSEKPLFKIPDELRRRVYFEVGNLLNKDSKQFTDETHFVYDLDLDSLDRAELTLLLEQKFHVKQISSVDLQTMEDFLAFAYLKKEGQSQQIVGDQKNKKMISKRVRGPFRLGVGETLIQKFLDTSKRFPRRLCFADASSGKLTYWQVRQKICILARHFRKFPEKRVGVMLPASSAAFIVVMALMLADKVPVMLNWTVGERNLNAAVATTGIERTLTSWRFINRLSNVSLGKVDLQLSFLEENARELSIWDKVWGSIQALRSNRSFPIIDPQEDATILFSSGTGAAPKGIPLTHQNLVSNIEGSAQAFPFQQGDSGLSFLPPFHSFGFVSAGFFVFLSGVPLFLSPNPTDMTAIGKLFKQSKATLTAAPPTFLANLIRSVKDEELGSLRAVFLAAEKPSKHLFEVCAQRFPKMLLLEGYGVTECSPVITMNRPYEIQKGVGRPLEGVDLKIVCVETFEELQRGEKGLILTRSQSVFSGYLGEEENPFIRIDGERWYNTGDIGILDSQGYLTIDGREKRCIKIGGEMLSLAAIEAALCDGLHKRKIENPKVCIGAIEIPGQKSRLHLLTNIEELTSKEVNQILKEEGFSALASISKVHTMVELPLTGSGKIDFKAAQKILEDI
jgi:long-chain-fatty-acid--[acyl-carrier-protein] ligase